MPTDPGLAHVSPLRAAGKAPSRFSVRRLAIPGVLLIEAARHHDPRGTFAETWRRSDFDELGLPDFVQDNEVHSLQCGTMRGLHFQRAPHAQAKLVRPLSGAIFDVAVDLRAGSPSFGIWVGVTLEAGEGQMLFVPRGFAHGYCTLADDTVVAYRCDAYYQPEFEGGLNAFDHAVGIEWPMSSEEMIVSDRDRALPGLGSIGQTVAVGAGS